MTGLTEDELRMLEKYLNFKYPSPAFNWSDINPLWFAAGAAVVIYFILK